MMKTGFVQRLIPIVVLCLIAGAERVGAAGKNSLFIGHSFFVPVAAKFGPMAGKAGISGHRQKTVYSRGASGSPASLWKGMKGESIRRTIASGNIELLGLTFYSPSDSSYEDYQRWVEYALEHNPNTVFFIGLPWGRSGGKETASSVAATNSRGNAILSSTVSRLRSSYPGTRFIYLNYGKAAVELHRLHESGNLPGVKKLVGRSGETIYADAAGHGGNLLKDLCALMWLKSLYGVSPMSSGASFGYQTDIKQIASRL